MEFASQRRSYFDVADLFLLIAQSITMQGVALNPS